MSVAIATGCGEDRTVKIVYGNPVSTLDPQHHNELTAWSLLANVNDALLSFSPELTLQPSLAVSWEPAGPRAVRFQLRRNVRFHDGSPFQAQDVVATFERAMRDPRSAIRHYLVGITRVVAEGASTVLVETAAPAPTLLNRLVFLAIVPRHQCALAAIEAPIGTGAYRFRRRNSDGSVDLEAFAGWRGRPRIARIRASFVDDAGERISLLVAGRADLVDQVPPADLGELGRHPGLRTEMQPNLAVRQLVVNPRAATGETARALADVRVRRAMLMAMNRLAWAGRVVRGSATVATQYVHPSVFGFDPAVQVVPYDPDQARQLLASAGFGSGFEAVFAYGRGVEPWAEAIAEDLARVGVRVQLKPMPLPALLERARAGAHPLMLYSRSCTTADASEFLDSSFHTQDPSGVLGGENYSGFSDRIVDGELDAANRELDPERRRALLQATQRRVLEQLPVLPLVVQWTHLGISSRIEVAIRNDGWLLGSELRWQN